VDYGRILRQAWKGVWRYRALWVFGVLLALTTGSWSAAPMGNMDPDWWDHWQGRSIGITAMPGETFREAFQRTMRVEVDRANRELDRFFAQELHINVKSNVVVITAVLLGIALIVAVLSKVARYVSEVALIRMVHESEATGERHSVWRGFRLGWSRSAWRVFLVDVLLGLLAVVAGLVLFGLILGPLPLWVNGSEILIFAFALITAGLLLVAVVTMIVLVTVLAVVKRLAWRACAVEGLGVMASIRRGWAVTRRQLKHAGLIWLITLAVRWAWRFAMVPVALLLLMGVGVVAGGLPAVLVGAIAGRGMTGDAPVFIAVAVGIAILLLVMAVPLIWLRGLCEVFLSSIWTLTYQELRPAGAPQPKQVPEPRASRLEAAAAT
jgi:hypothetical protein